MPRNLLKIAKEADDFFMSRSPIHETMKRLAKALADLDIRFAIAGAMAANAHGHRRTTTDVDVLISREDLKRFKDRWLGCGWVDNFEGSKGFRDTVTHVKVDVLIVGDYPGDGLEKPVAFPEPEKVVQIDDQGLPFLNLPTLIELKLASGMTAEHRPRDLDDTIQLIRVNQLPIDFATKLNPYVQEKFQQLWKAAQHKDDY